MSWKKTSDELLRLTHEIANTDTPYRLRECVIDRTLRMVSNVISSEDENIGQSSPTSRYGCKRWSKEAFKVYKECIDSGMTHKQACYAKKNGRSAYINEHEYPLSIVKKALINDGWSLEQLKDYMYKYGSYTVVTREEDLRLKPAKSISEAKKRYFNAGIELNT
jgi:hypothetical protein